MEVEHHKNLSYVVEEIEWWWGSHFPEFFFFLNMTWNATRKYLGDVVLLGRKLPSSPDPHPTSTEFQGKEPVMVKTQIITSPLFLTPVLAGKGLDGRGSPSMKRKLWSRAVMGSLWVARGLGKWYRKAGPGDGHGEERGGSWLLSGKETRTSKVWKLSFAGLCLLGSCFHSLWSSSMAGLQRDSVLAVERFWSYRKWCSQKLVSGFPSGYWDFITIEWSTEHILTPNTTGHLWADSHMTEKGPLSRIRT